MFVSKRPAGFAKKTFDHVLANTVSLRSKDVDTARAVAYK